MHIICCYRAYSEGLLNLGYSDGFTWLRRELSFVHEIEVDTALDSWQFEHVLVKGILERQ